MDGDGVPLGSYIPNESRRWKILAPILLWYLRDPCPVIEIRTHLVGISALFFGFVLSDSILRLHTRAYRRWNRKPSTQLGFNTFQSPKPTQTISVQDPSTSFDHPRDSSHDLRAGWLGQGHIYSKTHGVRYPFFTIHVIHVLCQGFPWLPTILYKCCLYWPQAETSTLGTRDLTA